MKSKTRSVLLKEKLKAVKADDKPIDTRLHRAISWLKCAEEQTENPDIKFISLWISFNACYAMEESSNSLNEMQRFRDFIKKLVKHDAEKRFFNLLWNRFSETVRLLIENQYVFKPFWDNQRGEYNDWQKALNASIHKSQMFLSKQEVDKLLEIVLDRLYILRNQLIHGGATFESKVNRKQVKDGVNMLELLVPIIIDIMLQNNEEDWGTVYYPVINSK